MKERKYERRMEDEHASTVFAAISIDMCIPASSALSLVFDWGGVDSSPIY